MGQSYLKKFQITKSVLKTRVLKPQNANANAKK